MGKFTAIVIGLFLAPAVASAVELSELEARMRGHPPLCPIDRSLVSRATLDSVCPGIASCIQEGCGYRRSECWKEVTRQNKIIEAYNAWIARCP
jgi:hypothetical protein